MHKNTYACWGIYGNCAPILSSTTILKSTTDECRIFQAHFDECSLRWIVALGFSVRLFDASLTIRFIGIFLACYYFTLLIDLIRLCFGYRYGLQIFYIIAHHHCLSKYRQLCCIFHLLYLIKIWNLNKLYLGTICDPIYLHCAWSP